MLSPLGPHSLSVASRAGVLSQFRAGLDGSSDFDRSLVLCASHSSQEAPPQGDRNQKWRILVQSLLLAFYRPLRTVVSTPAGGAEVRTSFSRVPPMAVVQPFVLTPIGSLFRPVGTLFASRLARTGRASRVDSCALPLSFYCRHCSCKHVAWHIAANL